MIILWQSSSKSCNMVTTIILYKANSFENYYSANVCADGVYINSRIIVGWILYKKRVCRYCYEPILVIERESNGILIITFFRELLKSKF